VRQAEAEGLTLLRSERSSTGYKGVHFHGSCKSKPYWAKVCRGGRQVFLGLFVTPEEAALCYARTPEGRAAAAAPPAPPPLTAEEAVQQAEAEGLTLLRSEASSTGYKGVTFKQHGQLYQVTVWRRGKVVFLGYFTTAEEAALCYARSPEAQAVAAAAQAAAAAPPPMKAEEAVRQAEAEGLTLLRSESGSTGYKGVSFYGSCKSKPYHAKGRRGGKTVHLGVFATAEEAALCYARSPEGRAAAAAPPEPPPPPPMTAEEAVQQAEAEGLTLLRSELSSCTGFKCVAFSSSKSKPYQAEVNRGGKKVILGRFATAEEAALCYARTPEGQAAAAAPLKPPPLTAEEAVQQAEAEGLTLLRSERSNSGYSGVHLGNSGKSSPYQARVWRGGKDAHLGYYTTAEEAALHMARASADQAAAPQPPPASSRKRKVKSDEQPPDEPADVVVILEGRVVESTTFE